MHQIGVNLCLIFKNNDISCVKFYILSVSVELAVAGVFLPMRRSMKEGQTVFFAMRHVSTIQEFAWVVERIGAELWWGLCMR